MFRQTPLLLLLLLLLLPVIHSLPRKSPCTTDADCDSPLSCLGNPGNTRCYQKKPRGMRCALDPFWVCEDGLVCQDRVCKLPVAAECNTPGSICVNGLACLGNKGKKRCAMKKPLGMRCGNDPFWVCQEGLTCINGKCRNLVRTAGACNNRNDVCDPPLSCLGKDGNKKCFMKKPLGMRCGQDPFWVCQDQLTCNNGRCGTPIGTAASCNDPSDVCQEGLSCVGNQGNKKCFMKKRIGMRCGQDPFWVCADKLACVNNVCRKTVGKGKRCGRKRVCRDKFVCAGPPRATKCVRPGKLGKPCGVYETCRDATCVDGVCVDY